MNDWYSLVHIKQDLSPGEAIANNAGGLVVTRNEKWTTGTSAGGMGQGPMQGGMMQMNRMQQTTPLQFNRSFLENMANHHAGAITVSKLAVQKAQHPELRQFAQKVIDDQSRENRQFNTWLSNWYAVSVPPQVMPADQRAVNRLQNLNEREFEIEYMHHMIMHHSEAVSMAQMAQQKASHPQVKQVATSIIQEQTREINQLRTWLSSWYGLQE